MANQNGINQDSTGPAGLPAPPRHARRLGIISLLCGVAGVILFGLFGLFLGAVAIIVGLFARKQGEKRLSLYGIIAGAIAVVLSAAILILVSVGWIEVPAPSPNDTGTQTTQTSTQAESPASTVATPVSP